KEGHSRCDHQEGQDIGEHKTHVLKHNAAPGSPPARHVKGVSQETAMQTISLWRPDCDSLHLEFEVKENPEMPEKLATISDRTAPVGGQQSLVELEVERIDSIGGAHEKRSRQQVKGS